MIVEVGTVVRYANASRNTHDRTVVGEYNGYVYMQVGSNPHSVESCLSTLFWDIYKIKDGKR